MKILLAAIGVPVLAGAALWIAVALTSPLAVFSALVPLDRGVLRAAQAIPYGPHPRQKVDIYRPEGGGGNHPVVVFSYGGAWNSGDRSYYEFVGRAFAAAGYVTVMFDYRLVPEVRFPAFVEDTAAAIAWTASHAGDYGGDPFNIFLVGHSAGAYNVAMAALDGRYLAAHGANPEIVRGVAVLAGPFDFLPLDDPATVAAFSGAADLAGTQPVNHVTPNVPPFLLLHGDADTTVGPYNSRHLAGRLAAAGVPHRLTLYPGLRHADVLTSLAWPLRWRAPVLGDILAFFGARQAGPNRS